MGEANIVKSGKIFLQVKSFMKTQWVEKFCILYRKTEDSHPFMDFYESQESFEKCKKTGKKCDKTIDLQHLKLIRQLSQTTKGGQEHLIEILGKRSKNLLMLNKADDCRKWSEKINSVADIAENEGTLSGHDPEPDYPDDDDDDDDVNSNVTTVNQMYQSSDNAVRFEVDVEDTDLAQLCNITGRRNLMISHSDMAFEDPNTGRIICTFSFTWVRRYGKKAKEIFHFEVGRSCPNGAGEISCYTEKSPQIHKLISKNSNNFSSTTTQAAPSGRANIEIAPPKQLPPRPAERSRIKQEDNNGIGEPSLVANMNRKHPGHANVPKLVPLSVPNEKDNNAPTSPTTEGAYLRDSKKEEETDKQKHASGKFKKELAEKLHVSEEIMKKGSVKVKENVGKKGSSKSKDEKREKEKREKELEKERKAKEKEEKKASGGGILGGFFSSKKEKDKDKGKESDKAAHAQQPEIMSAGNIYDTPEIEVSDRKPVTEIGDGLYDVADVPSPKQTKTETECDPDMLYDDCNSMAPVEYAQPLTRGGAAPKGDVYSDARDVEKSGNAWKQFARTEEEEHHSEDYSSIKSARGMQPPPVPTRKYDEEDEDDTYDRTSAVSTKRKPNTSSNIYGTASGTVGNIVSVPSARTGSDSEGECLYDDPKFEDGYEASKGSVRKVRPPQVDAYEEADLILPPLKPPVTKSYNSETLYEEVG